MDLTLLNDISYGLYVLGVQDKERPTGCIINTCMQITSEDPIFAICIHRQNNTYEVLVRTRKFSISILSEQTNPKVIGTFGFFSGKDRAKFDEFQYDMIEQVPILKENCTAALIFDVISAQDMETHTVVYGRLTQTIKGVEAKPMTYDYYHKVIKGKAPKTAPTFQPSTVIKSKSNR